ncbi:MAG TPA: ABC transporter ATP-binding protein [Pedococcus sp.]|nr:ABC transporter ATP-binding protein [Pedococcus sp.]
MSERLLSIDSLWLRLPRVAQRAVLSGVELEVARGEMVGLVGESGSGKSLTARAVLGLLPAEAQTTGRVLVGGLDVLTCDRKALRDLRASTASMVFQDPRAGLNPVRRIGDFLTEAVRASGRLSGAAATARALELLGAVGLPDPRLHLTQYPHQLSGGMLQRVMIAGALMSEPRLLLCDEPTTALDVTTQAEIVAVLRRLQRERGMGMLFITHDLDLAAATCDRVYVMYAGHMVEEAPAAELFSAPRHPYTAGLLASRPRLGDEDGRLGSIPGSLPRLLEDSGGCPFAPRCSLADEVCRVLPAMVRHGSRSSRCAHPGVVDLAAAAHAESLRGVS